MRYTFPKYLLPIVCAFLTLTISIQITKLQGINDLRVEQHWDWYLSYALNMAQGQGYSDCAHPMDQLGFECTAPAVPSAYRLPGYPVYLLLNLTLFGDQTPIAPIRLLQSVLIALIVFMTTMLATRLLGTYVAPFVGALMLVNVPMYTYAYLLFTETLFTFLLFMLVLVLIYARRARSYFVAGILLGLLLLTRGTLITTLPFLVLLIPRRRWLVLALGVLIILSPWVTYNTVRLGRFIPFSTGSGDVLWGANNPVSFGIDPAGAPTGLWIEPAKLANWGNLQPLDEFKRDQAATRQALAFLRTVSIPRLVWAEVVKVANLYGWSEVWYNTLNTMLFLVLSVLLAISAVVMPRRRRGVQTLLRQRPIQILLALWVGAIFNPLIFFGFIRFSTPLIPFVAILNAALGYVLVVRSDRI
ncbi:MAG: hypothetical protein ABI947_21425 [Chloroflexota bacterium]